MRMSSAFLARLAGLGAAGRVAAAAPKVHPRRWLSGGALLPSRLVPTHRSAAATSLLREAVAKRALPAALCSLRQPHRHQSGGGNTWVNPKAVPEGETLKQYSTDLTALAEEGKLDPVIGRDEEIRRCIQVLSRRTKNNPVLIGEPGVGKVRERRSGSHANVSETKVDRNPNAQA